MTKQLTKQDIVTTLQQGIEEAQKLSDQYLDAFVCCFASDCTPFRTDGREIRMYGGKIWVTTNFWTAKRVAAQLNKKAGDHRVCYMSLSQWAEQRTKQLNELIKHWEKA